MKTLIYNARLTDESIDSAGSILIEDEHIAEVRLGQTLPNPGEAADGGITKIDAHGLAVMPSFVDMHAHFRYPGQPQKEELGPALRAAAAGGFGTLVLMPNTSPVISSEEQAAAVRADAAMYNLADVIQTLSITKNFEGTDTSHLDNLDAARFPVVSEDGFDVASAAVMREAMQKCAARNIIMSCHCEDTALAAAAKRPRQEAVKLLKDSGDKYGSAGKQPDKEPVSSGAKDAAEYTAQAEKLLADAEDIATSRNLLLAESAGCPIHIAHVSTKRALDAVRTAKLRRPDAVTCEATPHHIALSGNLVEFVNPPVRSERDRLAIIEGLKDGSIDTISTDHAPHSASDKENGACGFTGLETAFAVCYTVLVKTHILPLAKLSALMSAHAARRLHINSGRLLPGMAANLVIADTQQEWTVNPALFFSKGKYSPFKGKTLTGKIKLTLFKGKTVYQDDGTQF